MKGLLYKDWLLIRKMGLRFLIPVVVGIIVLYSGNDKLFFMTYTSMVGIFSIVSTISYDEYDNGMPLLLSLPYTRQDYVRSKYLFAVITIITLLIFEVGLISGMAIFKNIEEFSFTDNFFEILSTLVVSSAMCWILLPIYLKYGVKKAMIAMVVVGGLLFGGIMGVLYLIREFKLISLDQIQFLQNFLANDWNVFFLLILVIVGMMGISYYISSRIMQKREY
ncbi:ABC-2 transporter permease [Facklamia miroungae]|uniref:ABC-2 family transporter protein n=1 Tax=Facklamia miroungae TaxID=120956 RepID=A0A1G7U2V2_9LACT|nr:ABC-2 transporter permease [Facklamia miroungae]NKZ29860.1 ABC-2 transporter permease [Facklamia miroungae]SDG41130.1 ABC-2 family transporter protein [Facklamia miroungae]